MPRRPIAEELNTMHGTFDDSRVQLWRERLRQPLPGRGRMLLGLIMLALLLAAKFDLGSTERVDGRMRERMDDPGNIALQPRMVEDAGWPSNPPLQRERFDAATRAYPTLSVPPSRDVAIPFESREPRLSDNGPIYSPASPPHEPWSAAIDDSQKLELRLVAIGQRLLRSVDPRLAEGIRFVVRPRAPDERSYADADGTIRVSDAMLSALARDSWLAAVLAYEIGHVVRQRAGYPDEPLEDFAIQLLVRAKYDPRELLELGPWILGQTSLGQTPPSEDAIEQFRGQVRDILAREFPNGIPPELIR